MINEFIENIYATKEVFGPDNRPRDAFPASLPYEDGKALYTLITKAQSRQTLEIGMAYGISTLFMLQGHQDNGGGEHVAIDPYQSTWWEGIGLLNVERAGFDGMFQCIEAPSFVALPQLLAQDKKFDFIFIDGNHRFEFTLVDFFYADKLLKPGGHVMFHDTWLPSIRKVLSFIYRNRREYYIISNRFNGTPRTGIAFWHMFFKTLKIAPLDIYAARYYAMRRYKRYCVLEKVKERDPEEMDSDWNFYRPF